MARGGKRGDDVDRGVDRNTSFQDLVRPRSFDQENNLLSPEQRRGKLGRHPSGDIILPVPVFEATFSQELETVPEPASSETNDRPRGGSDFEKSFTTLMKEDLTKSEHTKSPQRGVKGQASFGELIMPLRQFSSDNFTLPNLIEEEESDKSPAGVEEFGNDNKANGSPNSGKKPPATEFDGKNVMSWQSSGLKRAMIRDQTKMKSAQRMEKMKKEMTADEDLTSFPEPEFASPSFSNHQRKASRRASVGGYGPSPTRKSSTDSLRGGSNHSDWSGSDHVSRAKGGGGGGRVNRRASVGSYASSGSEDASNYSMQGAARPGRARRRTSIGSADSGFAAAPGGTSRRATLNTASYHGGGDRTGMDYGYGDSTGAAAGNEYGYGDTTTTNDTADYGYGDTGATAQGGGGDNTNTIHSLELYKMVHGKGGGMANRKYQRRASVGHAPSRNQRTDVGDFTGKQKTAVWDDAANSAYRPKELQLGDQKRSPRRASNNPLMHKGNSQRSLSSSMHSTHSRSVLPSEDPFGVGGGGDNEEEEVDEFTVRKMVREKMSKDRPRSRKPLYSSESDSDGSSSDGDSFAASDADSDDDEDDDISSTERPDNDPIIPIEKEPKSKRKEKKSDKEKKKRSSSKSRLKSKDAGDDKSSSKSKKRSSSKSRLKKDEKKKKKDGESKSKKKKREKSLKKQDSEAETLDSGQKAANVLRRASSAGRLQDIDKSESNGKEPTVPSPGKDGRKRRSKLSTMDSVGSETSSRSLKSEHSKEKDKEKKKSKKKGT